jgi:AcrR family transcriptional regulator
VSSTAERIVAVTRALIAEQGSDVSMAQVARAADISRQAVYLHFPSRAQLYLAVVHQIDEQAGIHEQLASALELEDPLEAFDAFLSVWLGFAATIHATASVLLAARDGDPDAWAAWEDRMRDLRGGVLRATRRLEAAGLLRVGLSASIAADLAWSLTNVPVWQHLALDCGWSQRSVERDLTAAVRAAITAPGATAKTPVPGDG